MSAQRLRRSPLAPLAAPALASARAGSFDEGLPRLAPPAAAAERRGAKRRPDARPLLALALVLAACDAPPAAVDRCTARIDAIARRLERAGAVADPSGAPPEIPLPRGRGGEPLSGALPLLVVSADEVRLAGRGVGGAEDDERLAALIAEDLRALAATRESDEAWTVALWVDPALEVHRLVRMLSRAPPEVRFALLFRSTDVRLPRAPGAPPWVREALRFAPTAGPLERRERLDEAWARATERCPGAREHLPVPAELAPAGPPLGPPSPAPLIEALRRCGCDGPDLAAIEAVALAALVHPDGPLVRAPHSLRFGPATDEGRELVVRGDARAGGLLERIARLPAGEIVWIAAE